MVSFRNAISHVNMREYVSVASVFLGKWRVCLWNNVRELCCKEIVIKNAMWVVFLGTTTASIVYYAGTTSIPHTELQQHCLVINHNVLV